MCEEFNEDYDINSEWGSFCEGTSTATDLLTRIAQINKLIVKLLKVVIYISQQRQKLLT